MSWSGLLRATPDALVRRVGSVLVLRPLYGETVCLSGPAVALWEELAEAASQRDVVERLSGRYGTAPDEVAAALVPVVQDLLARGLLVAVPAHPTGGSPEVAGAALVSVATP